MNRNGFAGRMVILMNVKEIGRPKKILAVQGGNSVWWVFFYDMFDGVCTVRYNNLVNREQQRISADADMIQIRMPEGRIDRSVRKL